MAMSEPIPVLICEPDEVAREELRAWLEGAGFLPREGAQALRTDPQRSPNVVIFGLGRDPTDDLRALAVVQAIAPQAGIVVVHDSDQETTVLEAMRRGACADLDRESLTAEKLVAAVRLVAAGKSEISPRIAGMMLDLVRERRGSFRAL